MKLAFIVNAHQVSLCCPRLDPLPNILHPSSRTSAMAALIDGWFQLVNGRPFVDTMPETAGSPRKNKSYLTLFDSNAPLGFISCHIFISSDLRIYSPEDIDEKVVEIHGRFSIVPGEEGDPPSLQIDVHRFVVLTLVDADAKNVPDESRTSVTLCGRVVSVADVTGNVVDKFFTVELSEYIRDHMQTFTLLCVTSSFPYGIS